MTNEERQYIVDNLKSRVVAFKYRKVDGSERIANGTLKETILAEFAGDAPNKNLSKTKRTGVVTYYDMDAKAWRSFKEDSFIAFLD